MSKNKNKVGTLLGITDKNGYAPEYRWYYSIQRI